MWRIRSLRSHSHTHKAYSYTGDYSGKLTGLCKRGGGGGKGHLCIQVIVTWDNSTQIPPETLGNCNINGWQIWIPDMSIIQILTAPGSPEGQTLARTYFTRLIQKLLFWVTPNRLLYNYFNYSTKLIAVRCLKWDLIISQLHSLKVILS